MNFAETIKPLDTTDAKLTENGARAYNTLHQPLVELFAQIGALRPRSEIEISNKFATAFATNPMLATKMMFYAGNIRGGLGERRTFKICLKWLAQNFPGIVEKNIELIPHFNRYDALFELVDTPAEKAMWEFIKNTLINDIKIAKENVISTKRKGISLLAKWMPTETAHSKATKKLAYKAAAALGLTARKYRIILSTLRKEINIVETLMSNGEWDKIDYEVVPSYAMKNYRNAFQEHDPYRFEQYKLSLVKGVGKVNASTLFPYDLVHQYMNKGLYNIDTIIEAQWKALPNYVSGENNVIIMADVSGSMYGRPMETSIGLATYFAQHNNGPYAGLYMTFSSSPHFVTINKNDALHSIIRKVENTGVGFSTNLDAAFAKILSHARENNVSNAEMPKALVVISDMEIDPFFTGSYKLDFIQKWELVYKSYGYTLPQLILWNVEARNDTFLSQNDHVLFVSGQSASVFKNLCAALDGMTAYDLMIKTLSDPMYNCVQI